MGHVFRWLMRGRVRLVLLTLGAIGLVYFLASQSLPDYDQTLSVDGLDAPVEIVRDTANVPHILGQTDPDVFFGLGYAHAQDRLWQMTILRRTVQGRLSEIFGARTVSVDKFLRRLDLYGLAHRSVEVQDDYTKAALRAYSAGVNARLTEINEMALGRGAPEMFLFNAPVSPWQPGDSLAIIKLMSLQLSGHMRDEVLRARTSLMLNDPARLADILPDVPGFGHRGAARICRTVSRPAPIRSQRPRTRASTIANSGPGAGWRIQRMDRRAVPIRQWRHAAGQRSAFGFHRARHLVPGPAGTGQGGRHRRLDPRCSGHHDRAPAIGWAGG